MPTAVEMWDPYKVLDISRDASEEEIKAAYKRMVNHIVILSVVILILVFQARRWHPDRHTTGKEIAAQNFIEVRSISVLQLGLLTISSG
jgi:DnaJ-class molecular chaperone